VIARSSRLVSLIAAFSFLFVSVVYACSGLSMFQMNGYSSSMAPETVERGPCEQHKQDLCKSVRDNLISLQASQAPASAFLLSLVDMPSVISQTFVLPNVWSTSLLFAPFPDSRTKVSFLLSHVVLLI
jgi:hypothetical protein